MLVHDVMTRGAVTCRADQTLEQAARLMFDHDLGFLPVVDYTEHLVGVITDRDILMASLVRGGGLRGQLVESAMTRSPFACTVHDAAAQIEQRMAQQQIRRVPVIEANGRTIGVVTLADIARASMRSHDLSSRGPTWTLAAITRPRFPTLTQR